MKRAIYEWGAILCGMAALVCLGLWCFALCFDTADFALEMVYGPRGARSHPRLALAEGALSWCSDYPNDRVIEQPTVYFLGPVTARELSFAGFAYCAQKDAGSEGRALRVSVPGLRYRSCDICTSAVPTALFDVRVSLLALSLTTGLLSAICGWRLCRVLGVIRRRDASAGVARANDAAEGGESAADSPGA